VTYLLRSSRPTTDAESTAPSGASGKGTWAVCRKRRGRSDLSSIPPSPIGTGANPGTAQAVPGKGQRHSLGRSKSVPNSCDAKRASAFARLRICSLPIGLQSAHAAVLEADTPRYRPAGVL
ncbi:MAG: hypothetical protein MZU79_00240, partial [Anaerotruncus sp.]|nr:hypothetical protein [Anaerotruncus sp.]